MATFAAQGDATSASFVEGVTRINRQYRSEIPIRRIDVTIRRLDSLVNELGICPGLAKIDVQGFELEVHKRGF
jgi:FkbM family methyltransferase